MGSDATRTSVEAPLAGPAAFTDADVVLRDIQPVLGRKWHPVIVRHLLAEGPTRFSTLKADIDDISAKMLSEGLSALQEAGVVDRRRVNDRPVRVEYALTDRGEALEPVVTELVAWGAEHLESEA